MKNSYCLFLVILLLSNGCFISKEYPVEYDYNFLGDFKNYKSFDFLLKPENMPETQNKLIQSTIKRHLELLGYQFDTQSPSFYVNYLYIADSIKYRGYEQPKMEKFILFNNRNNKKKEAYQNKDLNIKNGTLVINFTESSNYSMIWQGYTTDLYSENIFDDPRKVRVAVLSILNNYAYVPMDEKNN
jgi:hypothetical protein